MARKKNYTVGYGKPPSKTQFKPGKSGNKKGRPKGSKNLSAVMEKELNDRVPITENGREKRLSKLEVAVKQLVNKAAGGDGKSLQTIINFVAGKEAGPAAEDSLAVFDTANHHLVMRDICTRIKAMKDLPPAEPKDVPLKTSKIKRTRKK